MNILAMGINLWQEDAQLACYQSQRGHEVRTLGVTGETAQYTFEPLATAAAVVQRISREWPVDLLLCGCPELYPPPLDIEACPAKTAAMISDWNLYQPQLEHNLCRFDVVLCDRMGSEHLRLHACAPRYWGPVYSHRSLVHRDHGLERDIDIGFYGNLLPAAHPRRAKLLEQVRALSERYRVEISGEHSQEAYARLLNRTKIAFNATLRGEMNLRCFEAPACGALLFVEQDNLECGDYLAHGQSVVYYTDDTLTALMQHYLGASAKREALAKNGQAIVESMAAEYRMDDFFDYLDGSSSERRGFDILDATQRLRADALWYGSAHPPAQQPVGQRAIELYVEAAPEHPSALLAHGGRCFDAAAWLAGEPKRAQVQTAFQCFEQATRLAPDEAAGWYNLGVLLDQIGARDSARSGWERAATASRPGEAALVLGKRDDPNYIRMRWCLAVGESPLGNLHAMAKSRLGLE